MRGSEHDESFVQFVRESGPQLYRVAYLLTGQTAAAEDLYQTALTRSYTAWRRVREADAYWYVRRVLVNLHTDWWRAPRNRREWPVSALPERVAPDDPATAVAHRDQVSRALQALTRRERAVIVLRYFGDLSEHDIAQELGVSVGTVKSTAARALAKLRLSPDLTEPSQEEMTRRA
ncbi:SigE family RNA polymerase sigma factor [Phytohabitans flavus]|uniref:DNA-directed RNA polymerase sigma-70 factor n=1 Tax=Phytohabitans flavus TaxID=1076124 RepID=A0A6F8XVD0_9ACTN|nr:SigE family RNA polymerase sigma factor [Phytohabitans flavus]BCB77786.1 DNA-directed RNA polymerase sigma-70 factor [Phytohabitans flavus]